VGQLLCNIDNYRLKRLIRKRNLPIKPTLKLYHYFITVICLFTSANTNAQFDSLIFQKYLYPYKYGVVALGDQDSDGCDDILIYDCNENRVSIFFGGSPMDTIPEFEFYTVKRSIIALDVNNDQKKDIIVTDRTVKIYFGGNQLDTIPDIEFHHPVSGQSGWGAFTNVINDFNGDGYNELIIYDPNYPFYGFQQYGIFFIYTTNPQLDTIPIATIKGDTLTNEWLINSAGFTTSGDLDGDGLTDIAIRGWKTDLSDEFIKFYKGNSGWNTEPFVTYYKNEHTFDPTRFKIIEDINGDGKDDILISSYGSFYPYYYHNSILHGSIPIDTIPDIGLNTQNNSIQNNIVLPGDVNGDTYEDLLAVTTFGGPEQARLWVGGNPMPELPKQYYGGTYEGYGRLIAKVGDVNGDGLDDICVGQSINPGACISGFALIFAGDTLFQQPVSVEKDFNTVPEGFYLYEPYPNPFNPLTSIKYAIGSRQFVNIKVYDISGKEIATLVNEEKARGSYDIEFDATNLSSGIYFYRLQAGSFVETKKMVLMK
jgi:hypothetical protein